MITDILEIMRSGRVDNGAGFNVGMLTSWKDLRKGNLKGRKNRLTKKQN